MKKVTLTLAAVLFMAAQIFAQQSKISYCNIEFIMAKMPQMKAIESELMTVKAQYEKEIEALYGEYERKATSYQQGEAMMSDLVKADKQKEIQALQNRIQLMENNAKMKIMEKQEELLEPVLKNIETKINETAKEKGYDYVLNQQTPNGASIVLYAKNDADNITIDVLKKLGITLTPEEIKAAKGQ